MEKDKNDVIIESVSGIIIWEIECIGKWSTKISFDLIFIIIKICCSYIYQSIVPIIYSFY